MSRKKDSPLNTAHLPVPIAEFNALTQKEQHELMDMMTEDRELNFEGGIEAWIKDIKVHHSAGLFELPSSQETAPVKTIQVCILYHQFIKGYWKKGQEDRRPTCSSLDGKHPVSYGLEIQAEACATCSKNQFGSTENGGEGKACKDMIRCFLLFPEYALPLRLVIPPTSKRAYEEYMSTISIEGVPKNLITTEFSLEVQEKGEWRWSTFHFRNVGVNLDEYRRSRKLRTRFLDVMRQMEVRREEYEGIVEAPAEESKAEEIPSDEMAVAMKELNATILAFKSQCQRDGHDAEKIAKDIKSELFVKFDDKGNSYYESPEHVYTVNKAIREWMKENELPF